MTQSVLHADPYENGTPVWGADGTPRHVAKKGSKLTCSFDDSVEWLRPKHAALSKTQGTAAADAQQQASKAGSWCPFAARDQASAEELVAASR